VKRQSEQATQVDRKQVPRDFDQEWRLIASDQSGYVQRVNEDELMNLAVKHGLVIRISEPFVGGLLQAIQRRTRPPMAR
jgi:hypothetical protein